MNFNKSLFRVLLSLALVMTVTTVFSFSSLAAAENNPSPAPAQNCTGTLMIKGGTVTINGNAAQSGATVMNGSVISTTSGHAIADMGALGRVELSNYTTVTILCTGSTMQVRSNCGGKTDIEVKKGQISVGSESMNAGQEKEFSGSVEIGSTGAFEVEIECEGGRKGAGLLVGPGLVGLLALLGVGAAVAAGVALGNGDTTNAGGGVSPVVP